jgi:hypothetical protein
MNPQTENPSERPVPQAESPVHQGERPAVRGKPLTERAAPGRPRYGVIASIVVVIGIGLYAAYSSGIGADSGESIADEVCQRGQKLTSEDNILWRTVSSKWPSAYQGAKMNLIHKVEDHMRAKCRQLIPY